jgi:hypothetical protein
MPSGAWIGGLLLAAAMAPAWAADVAAPADGPRLQVIGTELVLTLPDGSQRRSRDLVGAQLKLPGGATLQIDGVQREETQGHELWLHALSWLQDDGGTQPVCEADPDGQRLAVMLAGAMDEGSRFHPSRSDFSFTCSAGVQAKCLRAGYLPWASHDGRPLADLFQACTRMMRADYCGDNQPHTRDGTLVDLFDDAGIQKPERHELAFEAGWGPPGAVCVSHLRIPEIFSLKQLTESCPRLAEVAHGPACTEASARRQGAILFNRSALQP